MATITYGSSRQTFDHGICQTQKKFTLDFSGHGSIDDSPDLNLYLKRPDGSQAFYVPEKTLIQMNWRGLIYDVTDDVYEEVLETGATLTRASGGDVTYTGGEVETATALSITPTANTTVQGLEVVVSADGSADASVVVISLEAECLVVNEDTYKNVFQSAATATLTAAE